MSRSEYNFICNRFLILLLLTVALFFCTNTNVIAEVLPPTRIVIVGDSITGLGENNPKGWGHLLRESLLNSSRKKHEIILLGGSGQSVGSWLNVEKKNPAQKTSFLITKKHLSKQNSVKMQIS